MGGYSPDSANVEQVLKAEGYTVARLEGNNRDSAAVGIAKCMEEKLGAPTSMISRIIVVGGDAAVHEALRNELNHLIR